MIIDYKTLSEEALKGIAEAFIVSHVSDGDDQLKFSDWVEEVIKKVKKGELLVEFSEVDESVTLKSPEEVELTDSFSN
ncbi:MAG: YheU family protein [Thiotrichales bacterium]|nr:YheU family protein [Thiotrichales bacterium]